MSDEPAPVVKPSFDEFRLWDAIFEARYDNGWHLWDRAGEIWSSMTSHYPRLRMVAAQPVMTTFRIGTTHEFSVEIDKMSAKAHRPGETLADFGGMAKQFVETVSKALQITEFTRLGLRLIFTKEYSALDEASKAMLATGIIKFPSNRRFGMVDPAMVSPEAAIRWEDRDLGVGVRFSALQIATKIELPYGWEGDSIEAPNDGKRWGLFIDVDSYTKSIVPVDHLKVDEWISMKHRYAKKEFDLILRGL